MPEQLVVEERFCGIEGRGQGGYLAGRLAGHTTDPVQIDFRNPIPLGTPMDFTERGDVLRLSAGETVIAERRTGVSPSRIPGPVGLESATAARTEAERNMPGFVGGCFSCGARPGTLRVHAGPVGSGRFATPYTPPGWVAPDGQVEAPFVWAPLDCASGWALAWAPPHPIAVTATLTLQTHHPATSETDYIVVAEAEPEWRTRRRIVWAALYTTDGELVANAESLWIRIRPGT